ncbi:conserved hypothetical protein, partial [Ricinus communis]
DVSANRTDRKSFTNTLAGCATASRHSFHDTAAPPGKTISPSSGNVAACCDNSARPASNC